MTVLDLKPCDFYIVSGNHDVDRKIRTLAFWGARHEFTNANEVEKYLSNNHERETLNERLKAFNDFVDRFCVGRNWEYSDDGLAYFSTRMIGDLPIGIAGLNSAITCGDDHDENQIVIGARPMIDISEKIRNADIRLTIGCLHHPPVWLKDFDQKTFEHRFLPQCDILHRGHLHEPNARPITTALNTQCLEVAAGATYFWREFANSYSIVSIDTGESTGSVSNFEYEHHPGTFKLVDSKCLPVKLRGDIPGNAADLATAIEGLGGCASRFSPLLAAIIDGKIGDVPLPIGDKICFGAINLIPTLDDEQFKQNASEFLNVRNALLAFESSVPLSNRVESKRAAIESFAELLEQFASSDGQFKSEVERRIQQATALCEIELKLGESSSILALKQLAEEADWEGLEEIARRYQSRSDPNARMVATTHLALALAHSDEPEKQKESREIMESVLDNGKPTLSDYELSFSINRSHGETEKAKDILLIAADKFDDLPRSFIESGYRLAAENGYSDVKTRLDEIVGGKS